MVGRFSKGAACTTCAVTARTCSLNVGVVDCESNPRFTGRVARLATVVSRDMGRRFSDRCNAIVAIDANASVDGRMVEQCWSKCTGGVAGVTGGCSGDMRAGFANDFQAIVATRASALDLLMIH